MSDARDPFLTQVGDDVGAIISWVSDFVVVGIAGIKDEHKAREIKAQTNKAIIVAGVVGFILYINKRR